MSKSSPIKQENKKSYPFDRRLVVVACAKGSTGKSTILSAAIEWLKQHPLKPTLAVFDPDPVHRTITQIYGPNGTTPLLPPSVAHEVDWRQAEGSVAIDKIVRVLFSGADAPVISMIDGVANQVSDVVKWASSVKLFNMAEQLQFRVTFIVVVDEVAVTVDHAEALFNLIGDKADYLVVRNTKSTPRLPWDGSAIREEALEKLGAVEMTFPPMTLDVQEYVDAVTDGKYHSLVDAMTCRNDMFVRSRSDGLWNGDPTWIGLVNEFNRVGNLLLPPQMWAAKGAA